MSHLDEHDPPPLPPALRTLIAAERRTGGPAAATRRAIFERTRRTLAAAGLAGATAAAAGPAAAATKGVAGIGAAAIGAVAKTGLSAAVLKTAVLAVTVGTGIGVAVVYRAPGADPPPRLATAHKAAERAGIVAPPAVGGQVPVGETPPAEGAALTARALDRAALPAPRRASAATSRAAPPRSTPRSAAAPPLRSSVRMPAAPHAPLPATPTLLVAEQRLLERARAALAARDPATALILLGEHARLFPAGTLHEERLAMQVQALAIAGRREEAVAQARAFAARFPDSIFRPVVEAVLK